jgi:hypothetical protein
MKLIVMYFAMNLVLLKDVHMRIKNGVMIHASASALILQEMHVLDPTKYSMKKLATVIVLMILWNVPLTKNSNMTLVRVVAASMVIMNIAMQRIRFGTGKNLVVTAYVQAAHTTSTQAFAQHQVSIQKFLKYSGRISARANVRQLQFAQAYRNSIQNLVFVTA